MTDSYTTLERDAKSGKYTSIEIAMFCMAFFIIGDITSTELATLLALISWTFDSTAHTVSDGTTTYTVNTLFSTCISGAYKTSFVMAPSRLKDTINFAKSDGYLTADESTALIALL